MHLTAPPAATFAPLPARLGPPGVTVSYHSDVQLWMVKQFSCWQSWLRTTNWKMGEWTFEAPVNTVTLPAVGMDRL